MTWGVFYRHCCVALLLWMLLALGAVDCLGEVIWAVNAGGEAHSDVHGIRYQKDTLKVGVPSDYGKSLLIQRVHPQDQILYQTERYHVDSFAYDVPISKDGNYVLVMKFSEVWFTQPDQKVFDIILNGQHTVVDNLDIFGKVGRGVAHDEVVPFSIRRKVLTVNGDSSEFDGKLSVEFSKLHKDNPKINAMYVMRGTLDDVPELPPVPGVDQGSPRDVLEEEEEEIEEDESKRVKRKRPPSAPKVQDPYATEDTGTMMIPVVVIIGACIPLVFCLCKL